MPEGIVKRVLILDPDLGVVVWLGKILHDAGFETIPATSLAVARDVVGSHGIAIDLLLVGEQFVGSSVPQQIAVSLGLPASTALLLENIDEQAKVMPLPDIAQRLLDRIDAALKNGLRRSST